MIAGLIRPHAGTIAIDGVGLTETSGSQLRGRIGFLTEAPGLWDRLSVREHLEVYAGLYAVTDPGRVIDRLLDRLELAPHAAVRSAELSKGMKQSRWRRLLVHDRRSCCSTNPPQASIRRSPERARPARGTARRDVLSVHAQPDEAERLSDRVAVIQQRLLAFDRPEELKRRLSSGRILIRVAETRRDIRRRQSSTVRRRRGIALALQLAETQAPAVVRALVTAGAGIIETQPERPALEDVYLRFVNPRHGQRPS
jgi:ABC-2 type transport system ATP-binding protein